MRKVALLFLALCSAMWANGTKAYIEYDGRVEEKPVSGNVRDFIFDEVMAKMDVMNGITNFAESNKTTLTIKFENDKLNEIIDEMKVTANITKGTDNVQGATSNKDGNLFYKGFAQSGYDTNGIYIGKVNAFTGGISKGFILKSYLVLDKKEQKTYKTFEFKRINFLDEFASLYTEFFSLKKEAPIFMFSPNKYLREYMSALNDKAGGTLSDTNIDGEAANNAIQQAFGTWNPNASIDYGIAPVMTEAELNAFQGDQKKIKAEVKKRLAALPGSKNAALFIDDGYTMNYATVIPASDWEGTPPKSPESYSDHADILNTHAAFATTIMARHNVRNGYLVVEGLPGPGATSGINGTPVAYVATHWKTCAKKVFKKCIKHRYHWHGAYSYEGSSLFTIRANDLTNFNGSDYMNLLGEDMITAQVVMPTVLPFGNAVGSPKVSHQGHILPYLVSFTGHGNLAISLSNAAGKPHSIEEAKHVSSFGKIQAGYTTDAGRFVGKEVTKTAWNWWLILLLVSIIIPVFADLVVLTIVASLSFALAAAIAYNNMPNYKNSGLANAIVADVTSARNVINSTVVNGNLDPELARLLEYSSVYEDAFMITPQKDNNVLNNQYSKKLVTFSGASALEAKHLKDTNHNFAKMLNSQWTGKYQEVFSGGDNHMINTFNAKYDANTDIKNIIHEFLRGN